MTAKVLVFDFDGTLVDSNQLKDGAYFELFPSSQKAKEIIGRYKGSRKTRYQIIREILVALKEAGEIDFSDLEDEVRECVKKFGEIVEKGVVESKGIPGAFETLKFFHDNKYSIYILSGTPLEPLRKTVEKLVESGKIPPFKGIYGRIDDKDEKLFKEEIIAEIMAREGVSEKQMALVGDGKNERDAALEMGCLFIGVGNESNHWGPEEKHFIVIKDLTEFRFLFEEMREGKKESLPR